MSRIRDGRAVALHLTLEQYDDLKHRADEAGLTPANFLRQLLGYPLERSGERKDLAVKQQPAPAQPRRGRGRPHKSIID
jgi:hypothetical protein